MNEEYLVAINAPLAIEALIVDCLLVLESERGFNSFQVSSHHHQKHGISKREQVTGRQKEIRFEIYVPKSKIAELIGQLREDFSGLGIHYWVSPVIDNGVI